MHSVWQAYRHRNLFRQLGTLTVSAEGFPLWQGQWGKVAMFQFRDNILIAMYCQATQHAALIETIRKKLKTALGLEIECDCMAPQQTTCTRVLLLAC